MTSITKSVSNNDTVFNIITDYLNASLYEHQEGSLLEPEKFSAHDVHIIIWTLTIFTYILAIPIVVRLVRTRAYVNVIDYFSFHIILCAFIAWIPSLLLLLYVWFQLFTLRLCRLHYVILSTNETVPLFFILYMTIERFFYAHPSIKQKCTRFSLMPFIYLYAIFTWLLTMLIYALASPFTSNDSKSIIALYTTKYCPYNYKKLHLIESIRSIIYFCLFVPSLILIAFVLRYFYLMRGTNQVPPIQKLWTIRVTSLLCIVVFYDAYLYYLEHIAETYKSFLLASILRSSFYLIQLLIIAFTEPYWLEILLEHCACLCCMCMGQRRKPIIPVAMPTEIEIDTLPGLSSAGHYSLLEDTFNDEFDQVTNQPEPALRIIV
ncbi:unnamed protein product [Rotaria magnacalcarata]|uniref:G-protein coupled receptors family 1 profile domain-containing protein n=2 Tax=Rotaria magnacalcarata TaxID=392030 RepID=A0A816V4V6_9BILA|nr:unnamed protein product [Rotaria magnacalcarata]CAF1671355.1 unnamed protein product [Rotaria magnacalcarata]CAF2116230.1 unnamed protein product [Rotaria magnacalcarata]CAF3800915.1 unnamed protein product [Rotaria magnacalcarata]CAF3820009.1 unnamed protein product [Rotaria magnacalcarata]